MKPEYTLRNCGQRWTAISRPSADDWRSIAADEDTRMLACAHLFCPALYGRHQLAIRRRSIVNITFISTAATELAPSRVLVITLTVWAVTLRVYAPSVLARGQKGRNVRWLSSSVKTALTLQNKDETDKRTDRHQADALRFPPRTRPT